MLLIALAFASALIVTPNDGPMYIISDLSPEICEEAAFIAEHGKTLKQHNADVEAYYRANPSANSYSTILKARAYCISQDPRANNSNANANANATATATATGGDEGGNANNVNVSGNQGPVVANSATVDIVSPAVQSGASLPPKKKSKAPAGCGTVLACGGYDEY